MPRRAACLPKTDSTAESLLLRPRDGTQGTACAQITFCHPAAATTNGKAARYFEGHWYTKLHSSCTTYRPLIQCRLGRRWLCASLSVYSLAVSRLGSHEHVGDFVGDAGGKPFQVVMVLGGVLGEGALARDRGGLDAQ